MRLRETLAGLALATVVLGSGCGGGGSDDDFARQGNEVCARAEKASPALDGSSPGELTRTIDRLAAASRGQAAQMKELDPPEGRESEVRALVGTFEQRTKLLERVRAATRSGGAAGFNRALRENAADGRSTNEEADRIARELGLERCLNNTR